MMKYRIWQNNLTVLYIDGTTTLRVMEENVLTYITMEISGTYNV